MKRKNIESYDKYRQEFISAMDDDLNTADAVSAVFELITAVNTDIKDGASREFAGKCLDILNELTEVLGILRQAEDDEIGEDIKSSC